MQRLGQYKIIETLSPYGAVQPAVARRDGDIELCTLKRLLSHMEAEPIAVGRFEREAKIARRLSHPNIVRTLEAGEAEGVRYITTEFIVGESLRAILRRLSEQGRPMPLEVFAAIALGMLGGIDYAHRAVGQDGEPLEIIHRNINPRCVIISFTGEVKISDFGAVKASVDDFKTDPGMAVGTLEYMSPEQVLSRPLDQRSDLYALGVVFYEMLTGRRAVPEGPYTVMETLSAIARSQPESLRALRPELPPRLVEAVERAMEKERDDRWASAQAMRVAVAGALSPSMVLDPESLGGFVRELLPEGEKRAISLLSRIREVGAEDEPRGNEEPTLVVEREQASPAAPSFAAEAEPSVMTMPGVALTANRSLSTDAKRAMRRRAQKEREQLAKAAKLQRWIYFAVIALAVVLGLAAWIVSVR